MDKLVAKGKKIAAHMMEAAEGDVVFEIMASSRWLAPMGGFFGCGFYHDSGQGFCAGVANDYSSGVSQVFFGGTDGLGYGGDGIEGALFADVDVDGDLRKDSQVGGQLGDRLSGAGHEIEDEEGSEKAVASGGEMRKKNVAGLLTAKSGVVDEHLFEDVTVSYGGAQHADAAATEGCFKTHVGHGRGDD